MGTNYYWISETETDRCYTCHNVVPARRHIGKSSAGWVFGLHVYPEEREAPQDFIGWKNLFYSGTGHIVNEYDDLVTIDDMIETITEREWARPKNWKKQEATPYGVHGPSGLWRHKIQDRFCIGHGEGTWDYMVGEFS